MSLVNRGDVFDADLPEFGVRPVLIVTRQVAIPVLSAITAAFVTSTIRDIPSEVPLNSEHGLEHHSVANCDNLITIEKAALRQRRGTLAFEDVKRLDDALRFALELD